jgi:two-component system sensor histidine kinase/response regulator
MKKGTILAVDDDEIILEMYRAILEHAYDVHLTSSGEEALDFLAAHPRLDLILLDIIMPKIDGYETCRRIRQNALFTDVKVIFVSSKMLVEDKLQGYEIGADDYLTKPFEGNELLAKIKVFMRLKKAEEINKIKTNFINLLYHETRTPLTSVFGYAALLRQSPNLTSQEGYFVEQIQRCGETILRSCEKTMLLSNLKSGNVLVERARIPLSIFLSDQQKFQEKSSDTRLEIRIRGDDDLWIDVDPKLFGIVIDTLLDNALKFACPGTTVEVTVKLLKDRVRIEVANEGSHITSEQEEIIFSEFAVQDVSHHHEGPGLSLAIARRIIEAHDGTLTVTNHATGTAFVIDMQS